LAFAPPALAGVDLSSGAFELPTTSAAPWETLTFDEAFPAPPVVIVSPGASPGGQPFTVKVTDITETGALIQTWEPDAESIYNPPWHLSVEGTYFAIVPGIYNLPGGLTVVAGTVETTALQGDEAVVLDSDGAPLAGTWDTVDFPVEFDSPPTILATIQTANNERGEFAGLDYSKPWMVTAVSNITETGFDVALDKGQVDDIDGIPLVPETIGYVAVTRNKAGMMVDSVGAEVLYESIFETIPEDERWGIDDPQWCLNLRNEYDSTLRWWPV